MKALNRQSIALISDHADPAAAIGLEEAGGQNVYVRRVGEQLASLGWQVDMFTRKVDPEDDTIVQHSPHCRTIRLIAGDQSYISRDQLFEYMPQFVQSFQAFQTQQKIDYTVIHTHYWLSAWIGLQLQKTAGIQLIHTYHSLGVIKYQSGTRPPESAHLRLAIEKEILEKADCVIATSPQEEASLRSLVSPKGRIRMIPCGTDIQNFRPRSQAEARVQLGWESQAKIVLYVGRFDPRKGIETLVSACAALKSQGTQTIKLVIIGGSSPQMPDGKERSRIEAIVADLGLKLETDFVGRIDHEQLPLYYAAADVCVVPSHYEPFGLVAIEAMACGTPVVASAVGGLQFTVIPEETGLLVPPLDPDQLALAVGRILADGEWAKTLGRQGSVQVRQRFSWAGVATQLSELYSSLLDSSLTDNALIPTQSKVVRLDRRSIAPLPSSKSLQTKESSF